MPENPLNFEWLREQQQYDKELQGLLQRLPQQYFMKTLTRGNNLVCYVWDYATYYLRTNPTYYDDSM